MSRALRAAVRAVRGVWGMAGSAPTHCGATSSPLPPLAVRGVASVALHRQCALPATEEQGPVAPQRLGEFSKPPRGSSSPPRAHTHRNPYSGFHHPPSPLGATFKPDGAHLRRFGVQRSLRMRSPCDPTTGVPLMAHLLGWIHAPTPVAAHVTMGVSWCLMCS